MKVDITQRILFGLLNAWERKAYCIVDLSDFDLENIYYHSKVEVDRIQERLVAALRMRLSEDFPDSVVFDLLMSKINHLRDLGKLVLLCRLKSFDTCSVMRNNLRLQKKSLYRCSSRQNPRHPSLQSIRRQDSSSLLRDLLLGAPCRTSSRAAFRKWVSECLRNCSLLTPTSYTGSAAC